MKIRLKESETVLSKKDQTVFPDLQRLKRDTIHIFGSNEDSLDGLQVIIQNVLKDINLKETNNNEEEKTQNELLCFFNSNEIDDISLDTSCDEATGTTTELINNENLKTIENVASYAHCDNGTSSGLNCDISNGVILDRLNYSNLSVLECSKVESFVLADESSLDNDFEYTNYGRIAESVCCGLQKNSADALGLGSYTSSSQNCLDEVNLSTLNSVRRRIFNLDEQKNFDVVENGNNEIEQNRFSKTEQNNFNSIEHIEKFDSDFYAVEENNLNKIGPNICVQQNNFNLVEVDFKVQQVDGQENFNNFNLNKFNYGSQSSIENGTEIVEQFGSDLSTLNLTNFDTTNTNFDLLEQSNFCRGSSITHEKNAFVESKHRNINTIVKSINKSLESDSGPFKPEKFNEINLATFIESESENIVAVQTGTSIYKQANCSETSTAFVYRTESAGEKTTENQSSNVHRAKVTTITESETIIVYTHTSEKRIKKNLPKSVDGVYKCPKCDKAFTNSSEYLRHIQCLSLPCRYPCTMCTKVYTYWRSLNQHMAVHKNPHKHKCNQCNAIFDNKELLDMHAQRHNKDSLYQCNDCGKSFEFRNCLVRHVLLHSSVRPFNCQICKKGFTLKWHLNTHMKTQHSDNTDKLKCSICNKPFAHKSSLDRHVRLHVGSLPYKCGHCTEAFDRKKSLLYHLFNKHETATTNKEEGISL